MKVRLGTAADMNLALPYLPDSTGLRHVVPGYVLVGAYTKSCASSVRWAREMFYSAEPQTSDTFALMDREAGMVPVGSDGLIYHPYLAGEASPYLNSAMSGMLHGVRAGMGRGHMVRAVFEGIAMSIRNAIDRSPRFKDVAEVAFIGGGTKSPVFLSSLADVLGRDGVVPLRADAAYGAALLAGHAVELWDGFELANANVAAGHLVRFNAENHAVLAANYERYLVEAERENALMGLPHGLT
jgi:xylulokinase